MCKRRLDSNRKGNISNGCIDPINYKEFNIKSFAKIKFGSSEPAKTQLPKLDKNTFYYLDDVLRVWDTDSDK